MGAIIEAEWILPGWLPAGRLIFPDPAWNDDKILPEPALWVSDEYISDISSIWGRVLDVREETGLFPLLLVGPYIHPRYFENMPEAWLRSRAGKPWHTGTLTPVAADGIDDLDAEVILSRWWKEIFRGSADELDFGEGSLPTAPLPGWPGLAAAEPEGGDPERVALEVVTSADGVRELIGQMRSPYLGLVHAADGAAAIAASGWDPRRGDLGETAAVIRSWQDRFGARLCALGIDLLAMTVASPPQSTEQALKVAAEHVAFAGDLRQDFNAYATSLINDNIWYFWWDLPRPWVAYSKTGSIFCFSSRSSRRLVPSEAGGRPWWATGSRMTR